MENTKQVKVPPRIWVLRGWLVILALAEIGIGLNTFWGGGWSGDYMMAGFKLLFIAFIGVISLICGILLFWRNIIAWFFYIVMLVLIIFISGGDIFIWLSNGGEVFSVLQHTLGYETDSGDQLLMMLIIVVPIFTLVWIILDRKGLWGPD